MTDFDPPFTARLSLNPETGCWELNASGTAAGLLGFLVDNSDQSLVSRIYTEAQFERIAQYAMADET